MKYAWPKEDPVLHRAALDWWLGLPETADRFEKMRAQIAAEGLRFDVEGMNRMFAIAAVLEASDGPICGVDAWPGWQDV